MIQRKALGIIPVRLSSTRLKNKALLLIGSKPLIQHTYENALKAKSLDKLLIATDTEEIAKVCIRFGAEVIMTPESCQNGTERACAAIECTPSLRDYSVVINIQGDEPLV